MECHWTYHTCVSQKQSCCNWKELVCTHKHSNDNLQNFTLRITNSREMGNPQNLQNKIRKQMPRSGSTRCNHLARFGKHVATLGDRLSTLHIRSICASSQNDSNHDILIPIPPSRQSSYCVIDLECGIKPSSFLGTQLLYHHVAK